MQRSESVLVYAVTAVLAVILVVAVVFGNGDEVRAGTGEPAVAGPGLGDRLRGGAGDFVDPKDDPDGVVDPNGTGTASPPGGGAVAQGAQPGSGEPQPGVGEPQYKSPAGPLRAPAGGDSLISLLGEFRFERQYEGELYVIHPVARGETFSELVQRFTGDAANAETVLALNEGLDPNSLPVGRELWFPWVGEDALRRAADERRVAAPSVSGTSLPTSRVPSGRATTRSVAVPEGAGIGSTYEIQKGDSLWSIAASRVGTGSADRYVREILTANPTIEDAGRIRAGQKILLPVTQ